jgi:hypothetical protein
MNQRKIPKTCYMCGSSATSKEHVPPRCLFPAEKDVLEGKDYRTNLITVPACNDHNSAKSKDDEYLLYVLSMNYPNNKVAQNQWSTKILRAIKKNPHVAEKLSENWRQVSVQNEHDILEPAIAIRFDRQRFDRALEHVIRALHFHLNKRKWTGNVGIESNSVLALEGENYLEINEQAHAIGLTVERLMGNLPFEGYNQDVFKYRCVEDNKSGTTIYHLVFYDGFNVFGSLT